MPDGFEDNFFTGVNENPFEDPAITQVTNTNVSRGLEEYDPFAENQPTTNRATPAVMQTTQEPPVYNKTAQQTQSVNISDFQRRQEELDRKAAELARREEELRSNQQFNVRRNNWPPLPEGFCLQPCFYLDIEVEIKLEFQRIVRHLYYLWILNAIMLVINVVGCLIRLIAYAEILTLVVSILYLVLFTPLSFLCWYRPVYKAFRNDSSFQFMVFFFVFFFQFLVTAFMAVGIINSGTCGFINAYYYFDGKFKGAFVGIVVLVIALGFSATAAAELFLLAKMLHIYRGTDASFIKARNEFATGILGNQTVQQATSDVAAAAIRSQLNQQSNRR